MKKIILITSALITMLFSGCSSNPFFDTKEEKAVALLEKELTDYTIQISKKNITTNLQKAYPKIYKNDSIEIISFGSRVFANRVVLELEGNDIQIKLITPCTALSCEPRRDDVVLFTKNKDKIKEAIKAYLNNEKITEASNSSGKKIREVTKIKIEKRESSADINCSLYSSDTYKPLARLKELKKNPTTKELKDYASKFKTTMEANSKSIIHNRRIYTCWEKNYMENILCLSIAARDNNISLDMLK